MGTDCKSAAFSFGGSNPPAPTKKTSVENTLVFYFIRYLKFHPQGWIRTASARRIVRRAKKPLRGFFRCAARDIHPRPPKGCSKTGHQQPGIRVCVQKPAPGSCCSRPGAGFLCVKDSEKGKGGKGEFRFYAAFAGAKTSAFFRRACIERTMQLRVKLMIK